LPLFGQTPEWYSRVKQIKLLETKRSEVEKLLPPIDTIKESKGAVGISVGYRVARGVSMSVLYSSGYCMPDSQYGYDTDKDVVIGLEIMLRRPLEISRFDFDLSRFKKVEVDDVVGLFTYANEEDGQELYGSSTKLSNIILSPAKKQEGLACENR
jgi:hypothetical protein